MDSFVTNQMMSSQAVTIEDVNRLLEVRRLLVSVLTPEEIEALQAEISTYSADDEIGNTGVS